MTDYLNLVFWILLVITAVVSLALVTIIVLLWHEEMKSEEKSVVSNRSIPNEINRLLAPDEDQLM